MRKSPNKTEGRASRREASKGPLRPSTASPPAWFAAVVLAIAIGVVFGRARHSPFIFDDVGAVEKNSSIRTVWPLIGTNGHPGPLNPVAELPTSGRPLVNLT